MAGLTAVPTWIILRAGVNGLDGNQVSAPLEPLLLPVSPAAAGSGTPLVPPLPVPPARPDTTPMQPPVAKEAQPPVLERRSVVDIPEHPVRKKNKGSGTSPAKPADSTAPSTPSTPAKPSAPTTPSVPARPSAPAAVEPSAEPSPVLTPFGRLRWPHVERPVVEKPERPHVERPQLPRIELPEIELG